MRSEVPPRLLPHWLVPGKKYTIWFFGLSRSSGKKSHPLKKIKKRKVSGKK